MSTTISYFSEVQFGCEPVHCRIVDFLTVILELVGGFVTSFLNGIHECGGLMVFSRAEFRQDPCCAIVTELYH